MRKSGAIYHDKHCNEKEELQVTLNIEEWRRPDEHGG